MDKNANFILECYVAAGRDLKLGPALYETTTDVLSLGILPLVRYFQNTAGNYTEAVDSIISTLQKFAADESKGTFVSIIAGILPKIKAERSRIKVPIIDITDETPPEIIRQKKQVLDRTKRAVNNINQLFNNLKSSQVKSAYEDDINTFTHKYFSWNEMRLENLIEKIDSVSEKSVNYIKNIDNLTKLLEETAVETEKTENNTVESLPQPAVEQPQVMKQ